MNKEVYIFGAQSRAKTLMGYFEELYEDVRILAFLVDNLADNERQIDGIPVLQFDTNVDKLHLDVPVFLATKGIFHSDIEGRLQKAGFQRIIPVSPAIDNEFRNAYVRHKYSREGRKFNKLEQLCVGEDCSIKKNQSACIYMAKSIYDNPLQSSYVRPDYEKPIQVGAALTSERLEPGILTDCEGDNISEKNRQYCELTALYWIWKHAPEEIVGLAHYRRHFILPDHWQEIMVTNHIDVILPVPTYVAPSIDENYRERHDPSDWDYLLEYLKNDLPTDYEEARRVFAGNLYSPCNMFIMRREILDELCTWMFPILDAVAEHGGEKTDTYWNRYPGFISERLITLYFDKYKDRYTIAYADKNFIS